ncbi:beta-lactamase family protein [Rhodococcus sp. D-46]|uniref:1,4-butanediol diacrylate esterase n=1 Tax=Rhodococcus qingshengii TaxID=334542 RepID=A0A2A5JGX4_RHOSG|nr:class A beta-lactamase-related serine hydrolase [Rhodococcus sp. NJ-530]EME16761.1 esterase [Rhodococcus qingshengii BKS 20-40]NHE64451.1 beta-lactamase family protein [Rhodococcus sp. D-46]PCK28763.1 1,4-butanediol diacrylate esterase [Rhodococcus qingshengii]BDQ18284.1 serine hydrolase [Rhodococcus qingshengii]
MTIEDIARKPLSKQHLDDVLARATQRADRVPGVVAMITDREGNIYEGAAGERALGHGEPMTLDTTFALFSTTKAITGTAVLQCVEEGLLDLDAPAATYVPDIGELKVLDGFDAGGNPVLREPKRDITTRMLLLHTAGFGYDFFNESYNRLSQEHGQPSVITCSKAALTTPLLFDPGEKWEYGTNIDWAGQVVESIRGHRLGDVMRERIFEPLEMADTAFTMSPSMKDRLAPIHQRESDGSLTPLIGFELPAEPEVHMGGHGLHGTVGDYMKFIRMWLNDGAGTSGRVLSPETVAAAVQNGLEGQHVGLLPGVLPTLSNDAEFFPGVPKGWAYSFMTNEEVAPTGRPAGSLAWAGLANLYYWIDRQTGVGGFWATQILPFADPGSINGYLEFETAVYQ